MTATSRRREQLFPEHKRLYVGIGDSVLALDPATGEEIWRTKLKKMSTFVSVSYIHGRIFASAAGEIFCLDPATGEVLWHNVMKGLGLGYVTFAAEGYPGDTAAAAAAMAGSSDAAAASM